MKILGTLCGVEEGGKGRLMIVSPTDDVWFIERDDLQGEFKALADETEKRGKVDVLGVIFMGE